MREAFVLFCLGLAQPGCGSQAVLVSTLIRPEAREEAQVKLHKTAVSDHCRESARLLIFKLYNLDNQHGAAN